MLGRHKKTTETLASLINHIRPYHGTKHVHRPKRQNAKEGTKDENERWQVRGSQ